MYLKRLDITGFKSFPDRIRLDFLPGLTAVVGPNGSGKSNIADAVRWVMGEQSVKSLRGLKMEDVIFSGTEHRRPLGYAEVAMTVDNAGGALPVAFSEVTVKRRLYRSGESEFAINGAACRMKDIQMLFMDTGVGREGYSIIGQGRIDEILSTRSEDRRQLFEEAAGIVKYKTRRNEALHKLERERQNLTRVNDIITELESQLAPLAEQAERAKTFFSLKEQYKSIHISMFLEEALRFQTETEKIDEALNNVRVHSESGQTLLDEAHGAAQSLKSRALSADARYKLANGRLLDIATEIEKNEGKIKLFEAEITHGDNARGRLEGEIEKRGAALDDNARLAERADAERAESEQALLTLRAKLDEGQEAFRQLDEAMRAREQALDKFNREVMEQIALSSEKKAELREHEAAYLRLEEDKERLNSEILHNDTLLKEEEEKSSGVRAALDEINHSLDGLREQLPALEEAETQLKSRMSALSAQERKAQSALRDCAARFSALDALEKHHEGYYRSVRAVLNAKQNGRLNGVCGAVGELIGVPEAYETAVEIALGGAAQNVVTLTEDDAKRAIEMLKSTKEGRATFLPLTAVKGRAAGVDRHKNARGFIGAADALVTCAPEYAAVISHLLGGVAVMDNLDNAMRLFKETGYKQKIVTLEGELLSSGGAMTGGGAAKSGIIGRGRQLKELAETLSALETDARNAADTLRDHENKLTATADALSRARERMNALLLSQNDCENQLSVREERLKTLRNTAGTLETENGRLMKQLVDTNIAARAARKALIEREIAVEETRRRMDEYREQILDERGFKDERVNALTELRIEIGRMKELAAAAAERAGRLKKERGAIIAEINALKNEAEASADMSVQKRRDIQTAQDDLTALRKQLAEQRAALDGAEREKAELDAAIGRAEDDERERLLDTARLDKEIQRLEMRKEQLNADSRRLYDEIWDEYGLTYQTALPYKRADIGQTALRREERRLKAELAPFTDINAGAPEAYKQLKLRYDFLTAQRDDILAAEDDLRAVLDDLTRRMEERFREGFGQISKHFNDVFAEMFGGGRAGLRLHDESSVLESGIEITAQPPGKSLQTIQLLSGGEKALTAIALLFGILRMKPSPFCVLDEIEAALDDANITRFAAFLKQYTGNTQFIIITHRKGTMEAADTLYGVTMQEKGISKLVSVRFVEEEEHGGTKEGRAVQAH